ncbi:nitrite reductase small subunit NirD [Vibrio casei]|uniref:Nitrite reductase (NAD(P)H) small subunit n=1 Tax=Vibrio casei TaxID=673372 RepID=A0A368LIA7_9VIBR|nr:nitrite reductase small subunit NirD [Vibrio casei]RCS70355.1 nitrite reductase (NAD(P)H) small subunit [Vibrio casei]SJN20218.1 Nitrite reductase [NAD(P)H] small subunit [Vibrio casei]
MWHNVCELSQLDANIGTGALVEGQQVALFHLPNQAEKVFAIDNWDPIGKAFVLSRGIVGDVKGQPCVASPLYKQHFDLKSGSCVETPEVQIKTWAVKVENNQVWLQRL